MKSLFGVAPSDLEMLALMRWAFLSLWMLMILSALRVPYSPAEIEASYPVRVSGCATMLMASFFPFPSDSSIRLTALTERGKSAERWPVCGEDMLMPFSMIPVCSGVAPLMDMSVCTPNAPRCLTSISGTCLSKSLTEDWGAVLIIPVSMVYAIVSGPLMLIPSLTAVTSTSSSVS